MFRTDIYSTLVALACLILLAVAPACSTDGPGMGESECYSPLLPASSLSAAGRECASGQSPRSVVALSRTAPTPMEIGDRTFYSFDELYPVPVSPEFATIGVVLIPTAGDRITGNFYYKADGTWDSSVNIREADFHLFGFMPVPADAASQILVNPRRDSEDNPLGYGQGAVITVTNFPALTAADVSVVVGVLKADDSSVNINDPSLLASLQGCYGRYEYEGSAVNNYVYLLLDHLYANVNFELYVDKAYSELRTFKLTDVKMTSSVNNLVNLSVEVGNSTAGDAATLDPVKAIAIEAVPGTVPAETQLFPLSAEGSETVKTVVAEVADPALQTYTSIPGYFAPADDRQTFTFTFTFDVYDSHGNLVRKDSRATNTWSLSAIKNPTVALSHGVSYRVKVKIKPTYLYQLGEADLDTPTLEVTAAP